MPPLLTLKCRVRGDFGSMLPSDTVQRIYADRKAGAGRSLSGHRSKDYVPSEWVVTAHLQQTIWASGVNRVEEICCVGFAARIWEASEIMGQWHVPR